MSLSHERVLLLEEHLKLIRCKRFRYDDICPLQIRKGVFVVGALDNIILPPLLPNHLSMALASAEIGMY